jgi:hypothetical protein
LKDNSHDDMTIPKPLTPKQHELILQQKRQERAFEDQRLDRLKVGLMQKMEAAQLKPSTVA